MSDVGGTADGYPRRSTFLATKLCPQTKRASGVVSLVLVVFSTCLLSGCAALQPCDDCMVIPIKEFSSSEYPDDPAPRSKHFGEYQGRRLILQTASDDHHFDFIFESDNPQIARIVFRDVDVSLMTPALPQHVKGDQGLQRIALVDRQWNRQQVQFAVPGPHVEVTGGDGYEIENLVVASLAKNCLNAGLWEVLLFVKEDGKKAMYYQGWFTFPLGHYKRIWEDNTGVSYVWNDLNWYRMEHWLDPTGTPITLDRLRTVSTESVVDARYVSDETILYDGEQIRKKKTSLLSEVATWDDIYHSGPNTFATFRKPGYYDNCQPWGHEFWRVATFEQAIVRQVQCPSEQEHPLHEIELIFRSAHNHSEQRRQFGRMNESQHGESCSTGITRIIIGGIDLNDLPRLPVTRYSRGMYMPMGIAVPPFYQTYEELLAARPTESPYYSFLLNADDQWIDHHKTAIDGPVLHRDLKNPSLVHLYLLSYERHTLVAHVVLDVKDLSTADSMSRTDSIEGSAVIRQTKQVTGESDLPIERAFPRVYSDTRG